MNYTTNNEKVDVEESKQTLKKAIEGLNNIRDNDTMSIKYLLDDIIDKLGIIEYICLRFKTEQTRKVLEILSQHEELLKSKGLYWEISKPCLHQIELKIEKEMKL